MAIATDNHNAFQTTANGPFDNAFTTAGSNRLLVVGIRVKSTTTTINDVLYNSVSFGAQVNEVINVFSNVDGHLYVLKNPASGSNTLRITYTGQPTDGLLVWVASYTGADQTTQPDSSGNAKNTASTSLTGSTTVVASNCWLTGLAYQDFGTISAGAGTFIRDQTIDGSGIIDSNGEVGTGSQSMTFTTGGSASMGMVLMSINTAATATTTNFLLMGA